MDIRSLLIEKDWDGLLFQEFCALWAGLFPKLQYECNQITEALRAMKMDISASLAFSLISEEDEGLCARALLQRAQEVHNHVVQLALEVVPRDPVQQHDDWIALRLVNASQIARLDVSDLWA